jgi:hypothetical protein
LICMPENSYCQRNISYIKKKSTQKKKHTYI